MPVIEYVIAYRDGTIKTIKLSSTNFEAFGDIALGFAYDEIAAIHRIGKVEDNA